MIVKRLLNSAIRTVVALVSLTTPNDTSRTGAPTATISGRADGPTAGQRSALQRREIRSPT